MAARDRSSSPAIVASSTGAVPARNRKNGEPNRVARSQALAVDVPPRSKDGESTGAAWLKVLDPFLNPLITFFTSLRLTVVCLALGMILIFLGTMAQDPLGLYLVQDRFFRSFFVTGPAMAAAIKKTLEMGHIFLTPSTPTDIYYGSQWPVFPGGYLVGGVLLINLVASHFKRFTLRRDKAGIWMVHFGIILLLLGQLGTDILSRESMLHLREGQAKNYSESTRFVELAVIDTTDPDTDKVVAIPQPLLAKKKTVRDPELPFVIRTRDFFANSTIERRNPGDTTPPLATQGVASEVVVKELPHVTEMDRRDVRSAVVEVLTPQGASLGSWVVSEFLENPQTFTYNNRTYELLLRLQRFYRPFTLKLLKFRHDIYPGTDIPKNFSSLLLLQRPDTGESREVLIKMNSPLRYDGETYYQADWDHEDNKGTKLQVVHNPSWLTPYLACVLVGVGLVIQFMTHLLGFTFKRKTA